MVSPHPTLHALRRNAVAAGCVLLVVMLGALVIYFAGWC